MKTAYFDCLAGAGGDMIAAVMLDAGLGLDELKQQLATLGIDGLEVGAEETKRAGLRALHFTVKFPEQKHHRNLEQITAVIEKSKIAQSAKKTAVEIFEKLAKAEAAVHGKDINEIHFHEVGAVDSIVDIASAAIGLDFLIKIGVEKIYCSPLSVGGGKVKCAHGTLPVPAPATAELLKGIPITGGPVDKELLTPTAAAILTTIVDEFGCVPPMKIDKVACSAGTLELEGVPNILRLLIGESIEAAETADAVCLIATNIDDLTGEVLGHVSDKLFKSGALDVWTESIYMKKNRPAVKLSVLCEVNDIQRMENLLLREGITFGLRKEILHRSKLSREFVTVDTKFGRIRIKVGKFDGEIVKAKPEFEDCAKAAEKHNTSLKSVFAEARKTYEKQL